MRVWERGNGISPSISSLLIETTTFRTQFTGLQGVYNIM